jgi:hypothetical protein
LDEADFLELLRPLLLEPMVDAVSERRASA